MDKSSIAIKTYEKIADVYTKQYFDDLSDAPYIDTFLEQLPKKGKILDVGCGAGQFTKYMMEHGFEVVGIDFSEAMLQKARELVTEGKFVYMDMRRLDFEKEVFDGLLVAYSLIHIESKDIPRTLGEFSRILKPGGYVQIIAQKGEADRVIDEPFLPSEKMFFNFFTKERLADFLREAGFEIVYQVETESEDPESGSDMVIYTIARKA